MKITVKDQAELKQTVLGMIKEYTDGGMKPEKAHELVRDYLAKNEFCNEEGHVLKLSLESVDDDARADNDDQSAKAIGAEVAKAVKEVMKDFKPTNGNPPAGEVEVREDWQRLLEDDDTKGNWGFKNLGEQALAIYNASHPNISLKRMDKRLDLISKAHRAIQNGQTKATPTTYASELVGADGGFLIAPEYREEIWTAIRDQESILSMTDTTPTNSNVVNWTVDQNAPWDTASGISVNWRAQAQTMTQSKPIFQNRQVQLHELYTLVPATDETLSDVPRLNNYLTVKAPEKIGYAIDDSIFSGTGAGQPLGFLNSPSLVTVTTASSNKTFTLLDLSNMFPHLMQSNMKNPEGCWIMTPFAYTYLLNLTLGSNVGFPIAIQNQNINGRIIQTLLGLPIYQSMHAKAWSAAGDIILCNLKGYAAFNKQDGIDFQSSIHLFFDSGATAFRWRFRIGGEPYLRSSIASPNDSNLTLSHFVTLAAR